MTLIIKKQSKELVLPKGKDLVALFSGKGLDDLVTKIEARIRAHVPDTSTVLGRKAIASNAYLASRAKSTLDKAGKQLTQEWRDKIAKVDISRRGFRVRLDTLRDEARKPLDDWGLEESARIEAEAHAKQYQEDHEEALQWNGRFDQAMEQARKVLKIQQKQEVERVRLAGIQVKLEARQAEIEAEELRLELQKQAIARKEEARIAEQQRLKDEAQKIEDDKKSAELLAESNRQAAEKLKRRREAETARQAVQYALDLKNQAAKAEQDKLESIRLARLEEQKTARKKEADRLWEENQIRKKKIVRESDRVYREEVNSVAVQALMGGGLDVANATKAIDLIAAEKIPNVKIEY